MRNSIERGNEKHGDDFVTRGPSGRSKRPTDLSARPSGALSASAPPMTGALSSGQQNSPTERRFDHGRDATLDLVRHGADLAELHLATESLHVQVGQERVVDEGDTKVDGVAASDVVLVERVLRAALRQVDHALDVVLIEYLAKLTRYVDTKYSVDTEYSAAS
jgi:hypothetical protein